ncbi:hypothetical protein [Kitasatospora sp. NPDC002040]|uniref:hypothetical protein n=1 Tax=Kitasatospora sp. NPDC002040 TaxID=3154661 RepID=UPI0033281CAE
MSLVAVLAVLAAAVLALAARRLWRGAAHGPGRPADAGTLVGGALLSLIAGLLLYGGGWLLSTPLLSLGQGELCAARDHGTDVRHQADDLTTVRRSVLPLRATCQWDDATATELIPGYYTPLAGASLLGAVAGAGGALAVRAARPS